MLVLETVLCVLALFWLPRRLPKQVSRWWMLWLFALALWLRLIALRLWPIEPRSYFLLYQDCARLFAQVPVSQWGGVHPGPYLEQEWPSLMPFVLYEGLLLRWFQGSPFGVQLMGALSQSGVCLLLWLAGDKLHKRGFLAGLLWAVLPSSVLFSSVLTNQFPALLFLWLALVLMLEDRPIWAGAAGACLAVSQLLRPEAVVALIAYSLCLIARSLLHRRKAPGALLRLLCCAAVYAGVLAGVDRLLLNAGIVSRSILSGSLDYKLLVGSNAETLGRWNPEDAALYGSPALWQALIQRMNLPSLLPLWFGKLFLNLFDYYNPFLVPEGMPLLSARFGWLVGLIYLSLLPVTLKALGQCVRMVCRRKRFGFAHWLVFLCLLGYLVAYTLLETQPRYLLILYPLLILTARGKNAPCLPEASGV